MTIYTGTSEEQAIQKAEAELKMPRQHLIIRVVQTARRGFFGIGKRLAKVDVTVNASSVKQSTKQSGSSQANTSHHQQNQVRHKKNGKVQKQQPQLTPEEQAKRQLQVNHQHNMAAMKTASQALLKYLQAVYQQLGIQVQPHLQEVRAHYCQIDLTTKQAGQVIGYHGRRINAVEELGAAFLNYHGIRDVELMLDTSNYRAKRKEKLTQVMDQSITQVIASGQAVFLDPMPARERKYLHKLAEHHDRIKTYSHGREPFRSIVIAPRN